MKLPDWKVTRSLSCTGANAHGSWAFLITCNAIWYQQSAHCFRNSIDRSSLYAGHISQSRRATKLLLFKKFTDNLGSVALLWLIANWQKHVMTFSWWSLMPVCYDHSIIENLALNQLMQIHVCSDSISVPEVGQKQLPWAACTLTESCAGRIHMHLQWQGRTTTIEFAFRHLEWPWLAYA